MELVTGIGGVFLFSNQAGKLANWYKENLGIDFEGGEECGSFYKTFEYRDAADTSKELGTTWSILPSKEDLTNKPRTAQINYRVGDLVSVLAHLRAKGVVIDKDEEYVYGKFAWVKDPEGNVIELYEPVDH